jgi:hypothetical protein
MLQSAIQENSIIISFCYCFCCYSYCRLELISA